MLQLLGQRLLFYVQLGLPGHVLQTAAATQGKVRAGGLQSLRTGLEHPADPRLDQLATRPHYP